MFSAKTECWEYKDDFIKTCFQRFGSMNKNDYEVELMYLVLRNGYYDKSDHLLSRELQIPISKVRRLRYEVDLRYPKEDNEYKDAFYEALQNTTYKQIGELIQFSITSKALREYLSEQLEKAGSYFDSSFNSNIIKLTATDLLLVISGFEKNGNPEAESLEEQIRRRLKDQSKEFPKDFTQHATNLIKEVVKGTAGATLSDLVGKAIDIIIEKTKKL